MVAEHPHPPTREYLPTALFRHPAWIEWKEMQGWKSIPTREGLVLLTRSIGPGASMAYVQSPAILEDSGGEEADYGSCLEDLSLAVLPELPEDCAFIRWDLMARSWTDGEGMPLPARLQELRMNASTRLRRFRKAATEHMCPDTMVVDLWGGPEALRARMDYRTRYSVRLAERRGTRVTLCGPSGLRAFHSLHRATMSRRGLPVHPESCFRDFFMAASETGLGLDLYLAESEGESVAAAIIARCETEAWYLFAASSPERRASAGPSAILYRALMDCSEAGCERMDLLGVGPPRAAGHPLSGLTLFKSGFGGRRRSRAGAWDFVLDPEVYCMYAAALYDRT
jgi:hypothetical protein